MDDGAGFEVRGASIPTATLTRDGDRRRTDTPIGTRVGESLTLRLDGRHYDVAPGTGNLSRRSFRVRVRGHQRAWLFTPATPETHRLVEGTSYRGGNEIGLFTEIDGVVSAEWSQEIRVAGITATAVDPDALSCALGYLLSAAFGTGARLMLFAVFAEASNALFPPG